MKLIKSFTVNHDTLKTGLYVSRKDGNTVTYDLRMKIPNGGDYLTPAVSHTLEHLCAMPLLTPPILTEPRCPVRKSANAAITKVMTLREQKPWRRIITRCFARLPRTI